MKKITCLFAVLAAAIGVYASTVSSNTAQTVAANFYRQSSPKTLNTITLAYTEKNVAGDALYYIFNVNRNDGFVIVSADDAASPIIGYSVKGNYTGTNMPPDFVYWMNWYTKQLNYIKQNNLAATSEITNDWNTYINNLPNTKRIASTVSPLVQTTWNQSPYYNAMCPGGSVTGCVATAMSQIMRYWNYPAHGLSSSCYNDVSPPFTSNYGTLCANYGTTVYNWSNMPLSISSNNNDVAAINYDAGVSVQMDYSPSGSGAWVIRLDDTICAQTSYVEYFGYDANTIAGYNRTSFADTTWTRMMKAELNSGRPVQYAGYGNAGGHTWVCDGYDASGNFDMNWGWGGAYNGYFALNSLNPGSYTFDSGQQACIGIQPPPIKAYFNATPQIGCAGTAVKFSDQSLIPNTSSPVTSWKWSFPGGTPSSSTTQNPSITYNAPGTYNVSLKVTNKNGSDSVTMNAYITITNGNVLPLSEGYEGSWLPGQWAINNPLGHATTWLQYNGAGGFGKSTHCMYYNNCSGGITGNYDQVYTPVYDFSAITNPLIYFDVAYTPYNTTYSDTLAVYYSIDCGKTWTRIYLKGGMTLCTTGGKTVAGGANTDGNGCFVPLSTDWRTDSVKIAAIAGQSSVMFSFENRSGNGTNMFVDNINIPGAPLNTSSLTEENALNIYPNPSNGKFNISFHAQAGKVYQMSIYNVLGQEVMHNEIQNVGGNYTYPVNLNQFGKGIYSVILKDGDQQMVKKVAVY